jgi:hypothetical protein
MVLPFKNSLAKPLTACAVALDSIGHSCDIKVSSYAQVEGGGLVCKKSLNCQMVTRDSIKDAFFDGCCLIFVTTNLKTQKLKFRLEACGEYSEGAIILLLDEIYKVSRNYDPSRSFDFKNGKRGIHHPLWTPQDAGAPQRSEGGLGLFCFRPSGDKDVRTARRAVAYTAPQGSFLGTDAWEEETEDFLRKCETRGSEIVWKV